MWVLILVMFARSPALETVPGYYMTKEECIKAGEEYSRDTKAFLIQPSYSCIPAPDGMFE